MCKSTYYTKNSRSNIKFHEFSMSFPGLQNSRSFPGFPGEWEPCLYLHHFVIANDLYCRLLIGSRGISHPYDSAEDALSSQAKDRVPFVQHFTNPHSCTHSISRTHLVSVSCARVQAFAETAHTSTTTRLLYVTTLMMLVRRQCTQHC